MTSNIDLNTAFDLLDESVREYMAGGRRTYSAALKPELRIRSGGLFDQQALGFETFRAFLRAAEAAGRVTLHEAERGPDVEVTPPGETPPAPATPPSGPKRLRSDLWKTWIDWTPGYRRVYDRENDTAQRIPAVPVSALPDAQRPLIEALDAGDARAIEIPGLSIEGQLKLMTEFASEAGDEGEILRAALTADKPAHAFRTALRTNRRMHEAWLKTLVSTVRQQIEAWTAANGLEIDIDERRSPAPVASIEPSTARPPTDRADASSQGELLRTRELVHRAVDAMTLSELLDLRIAVRHLIDDNN